MSVSGFWPVIGDSLVISVDLSLADGVGVYGGVEALQLQLQFVISGLQLC